MSTPVPSSLIFEQFVEQYYQWLLRFVGRKIANPEQAEDILHDALLDAQMGLIRYRGEAKLSTWVLGVISNKIRRHYRHQAHAPPMSSDDACFLEQAAADCDPVDLLSQAQRMDYLCAFIEKLPERVRLGLCQVALDGEAYALVAQRLNMPIGTLRSQLSRIREQLRKELDMAGIGRSD